MKEMIVEVGFYCIVGLINQSLSHDSKAMVASPERLRPQGCLERGSLRRSSVASLEFIEQFKACHSERPEGAKNLCT